MKSQNEKELLNKPENEIGEEIKNNNQIESSGNLSNSHIASINKIIINLSKLEFTFIESSKVTIKGSEQTEKQRKSNIGFLLNEEKSQSNTSCNTKLSTPDVIKSLDFIEPIGLDKFLDFNINKYDKNSSQQYLLKFLSEEISRSYCKFYSHFILFKSIKFLFENKFNEFRDIIENFYIFFNLKFKEFTYNNEIDKINELKNVFDSIFIIIKHLVKLKQEENNSSFRIFKLIKLSNNPKMNKLNIQNSEIKNQNEQEKSSTEYLSFEKLQKNYCELKEGMQTNTCLISKSELASIILNIFKQQLNSSNIIEDEKENANKDFKSIQEMISDFNEYNNQLILIMDKQSLYYIPKGIPNKELLGTSKNNGQSKHDIFKFFSVISNPNIKSFNLFNCFMFNEVPNEAILENYFSDKIHQSLQAILNFNIPKKVKDIPKIALIKEKEFLKIKNFTSLNDSKLIEVDSWKKLLKYNLGYDKFIILLRFNLNISIDIFFEQYRKYINHRDFNKKQIIYELNFNSMNKKGKLSEVGLINLGNTCFANAALQCLLNNIYIAFTFLIKQEEPIKKLIKDQETFSFHFYNLIVNRWYGQKEYYSPGFILEKIRQKYKKFQEGEKGDSISFLNLLIQALHEELTHKENTEFFYKSPQRLIASKQSEISWNLWRLRNNSIFSDLFFGQIKSQLICSQCFYNSVKYEPFSFINIDVPLKVNYEILEIEVDLFIMTKNKINKDRIIIRANFCTSYNELFNSINDILYKSNLPKKKIITKSFDGNTLFKIGSNEMESYIFSYSFSKFVNFYIHDCEDECCHNKCIDCELNILNYKLEKLTYPLFVHINKKNNAHNYLNAFLNELDIQTSQNIKFKLICSEFIKGKLYCKHLSSCSKTNIDWNMCECGIINNQDFTFEDLVKLNTDASKDYISIAIMILDSSNEKYIKEFAHFHRIQISNSKEYLKEIKEENFRELNLFENQIRGCYTCPTLEYLLDKYCSETKLDSENCTSCSKCKIKNQGYVSQCFEILPKMLTIHLNRNVKEHFLRSDTYSKLSIPYIFPIDRYCSNIVPQNRYKNYKLYAIINYQGKSPSGHYTSIIKQFNTKNWVKYNDYKTRLVTEKELQESLESNILAKTLFYKFTKSTGTKKKY